MKRRILLLAIVLLALFLGWRFIRPMNIFVVSEAFERPIDTAAAPALLKTLKAEECASCHRVFYDEWRTSMHSRAWTDSYFQTDWRFDGSQQVCRNCHTPLDRQQPQRVLGFRDRDKWKPILVPNPDFDTALQHEGVTCAACHVRDGRIIGVIGDTDAPHPVSRIEDPNQVCLRCHVVEGERWDSFFRFPPCGTVAEIEATPRMPGVSGERVVKRISELGCVTCHMPALERSLVEGGVTRPTRRHLWRGGHDPAMVKQGLKVELTEWGGEAGKRRFQLSLTNVGAAHYLPTGTPDRHLMVWLRLLDREGHVMREQRHTLKRTVMWRPFIVDLWDTRLPRWQPRRYAFDVSSGELARAAAVEAQVDYYLVAASRLKRIGYQGGEPTHYPLFRQRIDLGEGSTQ